MLTVVLAGLRGRWASFVGGFTALALGVGLVTVMGLGLSATVGADERAPVRFADSPVVVQGQDRLAVEVRRGPGTAVTTAPLDRPQPVDAELLRELRARWTVTTTTSGAPDAVGVDGPADQVRALVTRLTGDRNRVLTGPDRRAVDPEAARDARALVTLNALLGTAGGVTAFVSVFVVASTFAFSVALRRREYGLLRTAGATPGQVRRLLLAEATAVGVLASAAGCLLGAWGAPRLARALVDGGIAPPWFTITTSGTSWPYHAAFWTGVTVAVAGALAASRRAGRIGPTAALREADVDADALPRGRALCGAALLLGGLALLTWTYATDPAELLKRKTYTTLPMPLITGVALLSPALVRPMARAVRLPERLSGATGMLVRENSAAAVRRTAAVAAPVLVTVALAGTLLGTVGAARAAESARQPAGAPTSLFVRDGAEALVKYGARAVSGGAAAGAVPGGLDDRSIVVTEEFERHRVGDTVEIWRADGSGPVRLRVAGVLPRGAGGNEPLVTPANAPGVLDQASTGASAGAGPAGGGSQTRLGLVLVLGIALLYTVIALANTLLMATSARGPELASLRLVGATRAQILRVVAYESLLATALGAVLGLAVCALCLGTLGAGLAALGAPVRPDLPWAALGAAGAVCATVAAAGAVLPAWRLTR
ncbi:ABC transporter permease [Streptomyces sp. SKN60]|uniref:ABC transporter permease n=1 Tax=Streptomyces sp. SKN60 TaxID=2855506 RepID=UPI0022462F73|nr:ABC transporter permease [Streptomyces sp. SKN60]MCX2182287.1 ABC transporter permease [Streptomyces sp. SKN60]